MKPCIICRIVKDETEFNDEHVIPDSIKGYYHIYSVCTKCNSNIGSKIDVKLTNHHFIEFQRFTRKIPGKSGKVPNPFGGAHTLKDDPNQKLTLNVDENGQFEIKLLPKVPRDVTEQFTIVLDKKDEGKAEEIIDKFLTRNGIPKDSVRINKNDPSFIQPWIEVKMQIDIKDFKMAIVKIAYEFAVDSIPNYFDDPGAIKISRLLRDCDFQNMYNEVKFIGDGLDKEIQKPFSHLIDFENDNHYLLLFDDPNFGLICIVNLFNIFSLGVVLSDTGNLMEEQMLVGKNDIAAKRFDKLTIDEVISQTYSPVSYNFLYHFPNKESVDEFFENERHPNFSFEWVDGSVPFYDRNGRILYPNIDDKLVLLEAITVVDGTAMSKVTSRTVLDEELYIKVLPIDKLYRILVVEFERNRLTKL